MTRGRKADWIGVVPLSAFFAVFYLVPFLLLLLVSFDPTGHIGGFDLKNYRAVLGDLFSLSILFDTLRLGLEVTIVAVIFAFPLAVLYRNAGPNVRSMLMFLILLPLLTSTV